MVSKVALSVALLAVVSPLLLSLVVDGWVRDYFGSVNFSLDKIPDMSGKTVIVTGPTIGGIGYHSALELARHGARVILAGRSAAQGLAAVDSIKHELGDSAKVEFSLLDLSDLRSVQSFAKSFIKTKQPLHVLMNSAGVMACPFALTAQGVEMQFGTNHLGHFLLTKLLLPVLRRSQPSRIVTTSSTAHYFPELVGGHNMTDVFADSNATYSPWPAYGRSKLANVLFTMRLADQLRGDRVFANALHPGGVRTNLKRHAEAATTDTFGKLAAAAVWGLVSPVMLSPAQGAVTQLFLATDPSIEAGDGIRGRYYHPQARETAPSRLATPALAEELWAVSERLVADYA